MQPDDVSFLDPARQPAYQDVLVQDPRRRARLAFLSPSGKTD